MPAESRPNRVKTVRSSAAVGLCLAIAAGCGSAVGGTVVGAADGTLVGTVRVYGGPARPDGGMALNGKPTSGSTVVARSGSTVLTVTTDSAGRFTFHLPPGRYALSCDGSLAGALSQPVEVRSDSRTIADCRVDVP